MFDFFLARFNFSPQMIKKVLKHFKVFLRLKRRLLKNFMKIFDVKVGAPLTNLTSCCTSCRIGISPHHAIEELVRV